MVDEKSTPAGGKPAGHHSSRKRFSLVEAIVVLAILGAMIGMAVPVWANIRENAYEARARQNREYAESQVREYWVSAGQNKGSYINLTAKYMNDVDPGKIWLEAKLPLVEELDYGDIPLDYYTSMLILRDYNMPADEVGVATLSETGTVYYTRFKEANPVESCELSFSELKAREGERLQANVKGKLDP